MFKKGDLVKCNTHDIRGIGKDLYGEIGVILDDPYESKYPVEFPFEFMCGHDCGGEGEGWILLLDFERRFNTAYELSNCFKT